MKSQATKPLDVQCNGENKTRDRLIVSKNLATVSYITKKAWFSHKKGHSTPRKLKAFTKFVYIKYTPEVLFTPSDS